MSGPASSDPAAQLQRLFDAVVDLATEDRARYLDRYCPDPALRAEVEALLTAFDDQGSGVRNALEHLPLALSPEDTPAAPPPPGLSGTTIARYQIQQRLGAGGMGVVYKARDTRLERTVALKFLPPHLGLDPEAKARFRREARAASALDHVNICTVYDIDETGDGRLFIAMGYYAGETLKAKIARGPLAVAQAVGYALQMARGLARAHQAGIVHRDVKPANVLVTEAGQVVLLDFGIAKVQDVTQTRTGQTLGTVAYMSPEQARGDPVDGRTDVWSLGVVLYEMLAGARPFAGAYAQAVLYAILNEEPVPVSRHREEVSPALGVLVERCLSKDLGARYGSMAEVVERLQALLDGRPAAPPTAEERAGRVGRKAVVWGGLGVLGVVLVVGLVLFHFLSSTPPLPREPVRRVPFTSYPGHETAPVFSPDGNRIAFVWNGIDRQNWDIYVKQSGVSAYEPVRLTTHPSVEYAPAWSPDEQYIAFLRHTPYVDDLAMYRMPSLGGNAQRLTPLRVQSMLSWSPDGSTLYFVDRDSAGAGSAVYALSLATLERRKLTNPPEGFDDLEARISPDGTRLALARGRRRSWRIENIQGDMVSADADVYVVPLAALPGGEPTRLTFDGSTLNGLAWTPDGRDIIYASDRVHGYGNLRLWRVPAGGGASEQIPTQGDRNIFPAVSPDGRQLAYVEGRLEISSFWQYEIPDGAGAPSPPEQLIYSSANEISAEYSPDGTRIVFASRRSGNDEIWVSDRDGRNPVQLTFFGGPRTGSPTWSPDGRSIAFDSFPLPEGRGAHLYVVPADGGNPRRITPDSMNLGWPSWSRDGRWLYGGSWKVPVQGGRPVQVLTEDVIGPKESPDGQWLYYWKGPPESASIWREPVTGGEATLMLDDIQGPAWGNRVVFDEGIYFFEGFSWERADIKFFDVGTGETTLLMEAPEYFNHYFDVSPDREHLLLRRSEPGQVDLVILENWR